jgi:hypothetical protein
MRASSTDTRSPWAFFKPSRAALALARSTSAIATSRTLGFAVRLSLAAPEPRPPEPTRPMLSIFDGWFGLPIAKGDA